MTAAPERFSPDIAWRTPFHVVDRARVAKPGPVRPLGEHCQKCSDPYLRRRCTWDGWCWRAERARLLLERRSTPSALAQLAEQPPDPS